MALPFWLLIAPIVLAVLDAVLSKKTTSFGAQAARTTQASATVQRPSASTPRDRAPMR